MTFNSVRSCTVSKSTSGGARLRIGLAFGHTRECKGRNGIFTNAERLRAAFESRDLEQLVALLDERVVWRGLPGWDYGHEAEPDVAAHDDHEHDQNHDHEHVPLCSSRAEVRTILEGFLAAGSAWQPVVLAEAGDSLVVDPRLEPALPFPLHQGITFRGGRIVLIQDYPDRASALADLNP